MLARHDESVAEVVWQARLERAYRTLCSAHGIGVPIGDIAMLSGFADIPTFNRMFKRRYGIAPREVRHMWREADDQRHD